MDLSNFLSGFIDPMGENIRLYDFSWPMDVNNSLFGLSWIMDVK